MDSIRIDKWLWTMRLCKSRTLATEWCNMGRVMVGKQAVKASYIVTEGCTLQVKLPPIIRTFKVLQLSPNRLGAKLVSAYTMDITPAEELKKLQEIKADGFQNRDKGLGRPTKKERRDLDAFWEDALDDENINDN